MGGFVTAERSVRLESADISISYDFIAELTTMC
jgi:hypothetical protein